MPIRVAVAVVAACACFLAGPLAAQDAPIGAADVSYALAFEDLHAHLGRTYPGFALKGIDWDAVGRELLPRAAAVTDERGFGLLCLELVARLEDNHAVLLEGNAKPPMPDWPRWDPGFACLDGEGGAAIVYHVDPGGPADRAGVRPGMTVVAVDGVVAETVVADVAARLKRWMGFSSARRLRYDAMRNIVRRGSRGERVQVLMQSPDGTEHGFLLEADLDARYLPRLPVPIPGIRDSAKMSWKKLDETTGYIYVRRIRADLAASLDRALDSMPGIGGLVVDVRGNSGGGFDRREAHVSFVPRRPGDPPEAASRPRFLGPIAVLIDARCVSAGEGWASWFVARNRARLFGQATNGAPGRKTVYDLKNGLYRVRYPVKLYAGFLDRPIERRGLEPDEPLMPRAVDLHEGRDTVLEAARAWLAGPG